MLYLQVEADSGHYRVPGNVKNLQVQQTFPFLPPSTAKGFVESLCGVYSSDASKTRYALGRVLEPWGRGQPLRKAQVWSGGEENIRPVKVDTFFGVSYQIGIDGALEPLVLKSLKGEVVRTGVLYLGESDNLVYWLSEGKRAAEWLVPGTKWMLPIKTEKGYKTVRPTYRNFDLSSKLVEAPSEAWLTLQ